MSTSADVSISIHISLVIIIRIAIFTSISILVFFPNSNSSVEINFVIYEILNTDLMTIFSFRISISFEAFQIDVMIEKKSNSNKRIHYEMTIFVSESVSILSSIDAVKKLKKKQKKLIKKLNRNL